MAGKRIASFGMIIALMVAFATSEAEPVLADAAPPLTPPGSSIDPSSSTPVQMWSERVELDATGLLEDGEVHVVAVFRMRNTASSQQNMRARFPLEHPQGLGDGYGSFPVVENLTVQVDSTRVPTVEVREPSYWDKADQSIRWAAFDVAFPVGADVVITVEYDIRPLYGYYAVRLDYVLETGAGWFGPIALADIVLHLPYPTAGLRTTSQSSSVNRNPTINIANLFVSLFLVLRQKNIIINSTRSI